MKHRNANALALAISAGLGTGVVQAAIQAVTLAEYKTFSNNGASNANISSSTATWEYDTVSGLITQTGGTLNARLNTTPATTLFRHTATGLVIGAGGSASATTFNCIEGNFGGAVGANLCGNYTFGANYEDESTVVYSGSTVTRVLGGDDASSGLPQSVADYNGMTVTDDTGTQLTLTNGTCTVANCTTITGSPLYNKGTMLLFNIPLPPPPVSVVADAASTHVNSARVIDVLVNDLNLADPVTLTISTAPDHGGSVTITDNGATASHPCTAPCTAPAASLRVVFTPASVPNTASYVEHFGYTATGADSRSGTAMATVTVNNSLPAAHAGTLAVPATGGAQIIDVAVISGNAMGDGAAIVTATQGTHGSATVTGTTISYVVTGPQVAGTDSFEYTITDADGDFAKSTISVTIAAPPLPTPPFSSTGQRTGGGSIDGWVLALFGGAALMRSRTRKRG